MLKLLRSLGKSTEKEKSSLISAVRSEAKTEFILERAGPVIFKTGLLELIAFNLIPAICPARRAYLKVTGNDN